jgi:GT2 family glycosyltransferase
MKHSNPLTFCISTYNNLPYLKLAIQSVRKNSYFKDAPFIIHAENCTDGTNEWLHENKDIYDLTLIIEPKNEVVRGIGGGMNICADHVETEYIMFLHSDFYVTKDWDKSLLDIHEKYQNEKLWVNSYRIEPNMFNSPDRYGTSLIPLDVFGAYHYDFDSYAFENWAEEFKQMNADYEIPKGEGVSGLVKKSIWDAVGGNDPLFSPTSWDDHDLFLRMLQNGVRFILPASSIVWHFGARGSHRLEENNGTSSDRQRKAESENINKWITKWGSLPTFNEYGMIDGIENFRNK